MKTHGVRRVMGLPADGKAGRGREGREKKRATRVTCKSTTRQQSQTKIFSSVAQVPHGVAQCLFRATKDNSH